MTALPSPQPVVAMATSDLHLRSATLLYPHIQSDNHPKYFFTSPPSLPLSLSLSLPPFSLLFSRFIDLRMKSYQQLWRLQYPTAGKAIIYIRWERACYSCRKYRKSRYKYNWLKRKRGCIDLLWMKRTSRSCVVGSRSADACTITSCVY